jgi:hypothetical protein
MVCALEQFVNAYVMDNPDLRCDLTPPFRVYSTGKPHMFHLPCLQFSFYEHRA